MFYREHRPSAPLSQYVVLFWICEGYSAAHPRECVLPQGAFQLVVNLDREAIDNWAPGPRGLERVARGPVLITGVQTRPMLISTRDMRRIAGIVFRPGAAPAILGQPAHEFTNLDVDLAAGSLRERMLEAESAPAIFAVMEAWLLAQAGCGSPGHPAVSWAIRQWRQPGSYSLPDVLRKISYSERRFREVFRAQVGVPPKVYLRILRFQQALRQAAEGGELRWAALAQDCGYFDQAHFVHDFRAFCGFTPSEYAALKLHWTNHVAADFYNPSTFTSAMIEDTGAF